MKIEPLIYLQLAFRFGYFVFKVKTRKWCANNKKKMMKNEANFIPSFTSNNRDQLHTFIIRIRSEYTWKCLNSLIYRAIQLPRWKHSMDPITKRKKEKKNQRNYTSHEIHQITRSLSGT